MSLHHLPGLQLCAVKFGSQLGGQGLNHNITNSRVEEKLKLAKEKHCPSLPMDVFSVFAG